MTDQGNTSGKPRKETLYERVAAGRCVLFIGYDLSTGLPDRADLALELMNNSGAARSADQQFKLSSRHTADSSRRVLIVEDDVEAHDVLRNVIAPLGYEVEGAYDGQQALDLLGNGRFDVAVVDLRLPGPGGMEVLSSIKSRHLDVDVVILTAHPTLDCAIEALRHGACDFIRKPFNNDTVRAKLRDVMEKRRREKYRSYAKALSRITFPMAAQVYELKHGREALLSVLARHVEGVADPPQCYRPIPALPFRMVVSLNYDTLLEGVLSEEGTEYQKVFNSHQLERHRQGELRIVKPYGCVTERASMVVTEEDQLDFLSRWPGMLDTMGLGLPGRTMLFIGCDLMDRSFRRMYRDVAPRLAGPAYLIQRGLPDPLKEYWADRHLRVIDDDVLELLEAAVGLTETTMTELASAEPIESLDLETATWTETGPVRSVNQDCVEAVVPPEPRQSQRGSLFVVADGMGGHEGGEVASQLAADVIVEEYYALNGELAKDLSRSVKMANRAVCQKAERKPIWRGMGTTIVAAVVHGGDLYVANVGDSRAYLVRRSMIEQITWDHSFVAEEVRAGRMTWEQTLDHPQRNLLTRAIGAGGRIDVDIFERKLRKGDVIVLCSDGLTEYVTDEEIEEEVRMSPAGSAVKRLARFASQRGGSDNISIIVVKVS